MYASYYYSAGSTAANILADVVAILTGETNKANLSASCNQTNTNIDASANVAGWSVYDASAGTNAQCLRAAVADNSSQYKHLVLDFSSAGYMKMKVYDTWNNSAHTGTSMASYSDNNNYVPRINLSAGGVLYITASVRHCLVFSYQNSAWGSTTGANWAGILERTRRSPWDTVSNALPPFIFACGLTYMYEPRRLNNLGAEVSTTGAPVTYQHPLGTTAPPTTTVPIDSNVNLGHAMLPFGVINIGDGHFGGDITSLTDIWLTTHNYGSTGDTIVYNGNEYIIWAIAATFRIAIRKG